MQCVLFLQLCSKSFYSINNYFGNLWSYLIYLCIEHSFCFCLVWSIVWNHFILVFYFVLCDLLSIISLFHSGIFRMWLCRQHDSNEVHKCGWHCIQSKIIGETEMVFDWTVCLGIKCKVLWAVLKIGHCAI